MCRAFNRTSGEWCARRAPYERTPRAQLEAELRRVQSGGQRIDPSLSHPRARLEVPWLGDFQDGAPWVYGVVVDSVNVNVFEYAPVRSGSDAPMVCLKRMLSGSLLTGPL